MVSLEAIAGRAVVYGEGVWVVSEYLKILVSCYLRL